MPQSHTLSICCVNSCLKEQGEKTWICLMCFHTMKALTMLKHRLCVTLKVTGVFLCICPLSALSALRTGVRVTTLQSSAPFGPLLCTTEGKPSFRTVPGTQPSSPQSLWVSIGPVHTPPFLFQLVFYSCIF